MYPVGFSDPVVNEGSDDVSTVSLRKPLCSLTDLDAKVTFTPDIYIILIFSVSSCFRTHFPLDDTMHATHMYR